MVIAPTSGGSPGTFATRVARLHADLARDGVPLADMRRAQSLELHMAGTPDRPSRPSGRTPGVEPVEGPIESRVVPPLPTNASGLRYFLDGAQRTFLVWRCGLVPVVATVAAAAVLTRDAAGRCEVVPGTLRLAHAFLIPRRNPASALADVLRRIDGLGMEVVDPLAAIEDDGDYAAAVADYGHLVELAYKAANGVRKGLEEDLLRVWAADPARATDPGWLVVDGSLRIAAPRAIGLVKQFTDPYLAGADAETLLMLAPGSRTTAFRPRPSDWRRQIRTDAVDGDDEADTAPTLWYLRLWDAAGLDARHALIRVEAGPDVRETARIDELSAWLMCERTPRATGDARWATLLYPVHFLERILKRRLEADTRGWPGG